MTTKSFFSRATVKGAAAALVVAAGAAGATFAVAQQGAGGQAVVGGVTYTTDSVDTVVELQAALQTATSKADIVKLLNLAAQAGLNKGQVLQALNGAQSGASEGTQVLLASVATAVSNSTASNTTQLSFYEGSNQDETATGAVGGGLGNNAAAGSPVDTANVDGGTGPSTGGTTTTVVYVG